MTDCFLASRPEHSKPVTLIEEGAFKPWLEQQFAATRSWLAAAGFQARPGSVCLAPDQDQRLGRVFAGVESLADPWACAGLPAALPAGGYHLEASASPEVMTRLTLGWGLGAYQFTRYKSPKQTMALLAADPACDLGSVRQHLQAITLVRDLINTPAADMMPEHLAEAALTLAREFGARVEQVVGDELLRQNFPLIHAVGRASQHPPRLVDLRWGEETHPRLTLVGKGVCFDSGGLNLKPAEAMRLMKKDMGGAAHALGLARLIMDSGLPVRLRVLVAAVENAVAGNALRPGDIIRSRQGLTIEIDNTDAEGRLILCDALAEVSAEQPALLLDFATLTGAARIALGADVPALFCNADELAGGLLAAAERERDPIWRLPLHKPYREMLDSKVADLVNSASSRYAGAITAALFLQEFVPAGLPWAHFDLMAWNTKSRPGRPEGGEAMGLRAVYAFLKQRFSG